MLYADKYTYMSAWYYLALRKQITKQLAKKQVLPQNAENNMLNLRRSKRGRNESSD